MIRLLLILVAVAALGGVAQAADATKPATPRAHVAMLPPVGDYPDAPCEDPATDGGNFYLGDNGDFWECICEVRTFVSPPHDCAWYNQGPITSEESRKLKSKLHRKTIPRGRAINTKLWRVMPV